MQGNGSNARRQPAQDPIEELVDRETGEIIEPGDRPQDDLADDATLNDMFGKREGRSADGSIWLPKITMATIRAIPARCKEIGETGSKYKVAIFAGIASGTKVMSNAEKTETFVALIGEFSAIRFDMAGEPDAIFKSDTMFLPIGHDGALVRLERQGSIAFSLEFSSQPAGNPLGYSWTYINLAQIDRDNLSPIDRLIRHSVATSRDRASSLAVGLLADLRRDPDQKAIA